MKKLKKILALMLAVVMTLALSGITAFAAQEGGGTEPALTTGSITINNATIGKNYTIYKIFDANPSGNDGTVAYTATQAQKDFFEGKERNPFQFKKNIKGTYNVSKKSYIVAGEEVTVSDKEVIDFLKDFYTEEKNEETGETTYKLDPGFSAIVTKVREETANSATVEFDKIPYGYYLVTSALGVVITVDSTNKDVTVQDKNQKPGPFDKKIEVVKDGVTQFVEKSTVNYGDTVKYVLKTTATNYDGEKQITKYVVHDVLCEGLENLTITGVEVFGTEDSEPKKLVLNSDYSVSDVSINEDENNVVEKKDITITWATKNEGDDTYTSLYEPNSIIKVYCTAKVKIGANVGGDKPLINKGQASWYTDEPDNPDEPEGTTQEEKVESYTYGIGIYKTDAKGKALAGAKFTIKDENGNEIKVKAVEGQEGVYNYDPAGSTEVVSPANGIIIVKGLAAEGAYTFHETEAPAGYNVLLNDVTVEATELTHSTTKIEIIKDSEGNITKIEQVSAETEGKDIVELPVAAFTTNIVNNAGTELPSTGGIGTTIFYVIGGILVIGAGILLVVKRRMRGQL